ncbi:DinB family protein [Rhodoferax sp. BAB1]|uniref:DinB family protein n=1 Tax=Rhodoferax sp. BAB1 TaxID=2741720 RepID=UPI0020C6BB44|nr:DinB family protein [Rhodoferax sp. BAB1]
MSDAAVPYLRMLSRYTAWANARLFDALAALPAGEATTRRNHGQHSMVGTLAHAWVVDLIWQAHLQGRAHGYSSRQPEVEPTLAQLQQDQAALDQWYIACADGLDAAGEAEVVDFRFVDGGAGAMRRGDMLLHVVNHKTYHRGYVADMLYQAGCRPPVMDLPVFLRDVPQV